MINFRLIIIRGELIIFKYLLCVIMSLVLLVLVLLNMCLVAFSLLAKFLPQICYAIFTFHKLCI